MASGVRVEIEHLPRCLVWIVAGLEGVTVALLPYVSSLPAQGPIAKPPESGFLLGYIGMLTALLLVNACGGKLPSLNLPGGLLRIHRPWLVSIWGGLYLSLIFLFQAVFDFSPHTTVSIMLRAACSLAVSTLTLLWLYRFSVRLSPLLAVSFSSGSATSRIVGTAIWPLVLFLALYETLALPVIELIREFQHYRFLAGLLLGLAAGAMATACVVLIYNPLSRRFAGARLYLIVESQDHVDIEPPPPPGPSTGRTDQRDEACRMAGAKRQSRGDEKAIS